MQSWVSAWLRRIWARKLWLVALLLYKIAEDRILSGLNAALDGLVGPDVTAFLIQSIPWLTWLAIPLTVVAILYIGYRDSQAGDGPYQRFSSEWASRDQDGHWNGIRERANELRSDIKQVAASAGDRVTVKELTTLKERVDSLEVHVAGYEEVWGLQSFWDEASRNRWERTRRSSGDMPDPGWAQPLWRRVDYVTWWLYGHIPQTRPVPGYGGYDPWAGWSDMGS